MIIKQWDFDENQINDDKFWHHYNGMRRLKDLQTVINYLKNESLKGKLVLLDASEGGPLMMGLTMLYPNDTLATINGVLAGP